MQPTTTEIAVVERVERHPLARRHDPVPRALAGRLRRSPLAFVVSSTVFLALSSIGLRAAVASTPHNLSPARTVQLLQGAYGSVNPRPFMATQIVTLAGHAATYRRYDEVTSSKRLYNADSGRPWALGDAATAFPTGLDGFSDRDSGVVYLNVRSGVSTTTPHEVLHVNSSSEFVSAVGDAINEGMTEELALYALAAAGVRPPAVAHYPQERAVVAELTKVVGRDRMVQAYFQGGQSLSDLIAVVGPDTFRKVKGAADAHNASGALELLRGHRAAQADPASSATVQTAGAGTAEPDR